MNKILLSALFSSLIAITTILITSLQIDHVLAKTTDSWYDLEKKKNWEVAGPFDFGIKILNNWAWQKVYYEPENMLGWHQNNAIEMYPNNFDNTTLVYGFIAKDEHYTLKNTAINTYSNYKKNTPDYSTISDSNTKFISEQDIIISDQPAKKLLYENPLYKGKIAMYLTLFNGEPYIGVYEANTKYFDQYITEFEEILQSLTFIETEEEEEETTESEIESSFNNK